MRCKPEITEIAKVIIQYLNSNTSRMPTSMYQVKRVDSNFIHWGCRTSVVSWSTIAPANKCSHAPRHTIHITKLASQKTNFQGNFFKNKQTGKMKIWLVLWNSDSQESHASRSLKVVFQYENWSSPWKAVFDKNAPQICVWDVPLCQIVTYHNSIFDQTASKSEKEITECNFDMLQWIYIDCVCCHQCKSLPKWHNHNQWQRNTSDNYQPTIARHNKKNYPPMKQTTQCWTTAHDSWC